jgi:hypothetical protein
MIVIFFIFYRKNEYNCDEGDRDDDLGHDLGGLGPPISNPHSQGNWSNEAKQFIGIY